MTTLTLLFGATVNPPAVTSRVNPSLRMLLDALNSFGAAKVMGLSELFSTRRSTGKRAGSRALRGRHRTFPSTVLIAMATGGGTSPPTAAVLKGLAAWR